MSGSGGAPGKLANPLGPGLPMPGGETLDQPQPRQPGAGGGPGAGGSPAGNLRPQMPSGLEAAHKALQGSFTQAKAMYEETTRALVKVDHVRKGLEKLAEKGDVVSPEMVIGEASKLVAHGIDPAMLAGVLADMPQEGGGEALGAWVTGHAVATAQMEQQLQQAQKVAQHDMGVAAIHMLTAHDVSRAIAGPGPQPEASANGGNSLGGVGGPPPPTPMGGSLGLGQMSQGPQNQGPQSGGDQEQMG